MNRRHVGAGLLVVCTFLGCFTVVEPLKETPDAATPVPRLKPNLMLLIDNSGSMTDTLGNTTRIDALKAAAAHVLTVTGASVRYGVAVFPENQGATQSIRVALPAASTTDDDAVLEAKALEVNGAIQQLTPMGGTPTAASVSFVGSDASLRADDQRDDFIVLITDGVPNLNAANPNALCGCAPSGCSQAQIDACACTQAASTCLQPAGNLCALACLDRDATVAAIEDLRSSGQVTTFVVNYGEDVSSGPQKGVMNSMAAAGGTGTSYQATSQAELQQVLLDIVGRIAATADAGT